MPTEITSDEGNADTVIGTGMAMSSAMATSVPTPQIEINAPSGFETTDTYNGGAAFESENGGRIDVIIITAEMTIQSRCITNMKMMYRHILPKIKSIIIFTELMTAESLWKEVVNSNQIKY